MPSRTIFDRNNDGLRDSDSDAELMHPRHGTPRVAVPSAFYKIIAVERQGGEVATITIILPHVAVSRRGVQTGQYFQQNVSTIARVERATRLHFFPNGTRVTEVSDFCAFARGVPPSYCRTRSTAQIQDVSANCITRVLGAVN